MSYIDPERIEPRGKLLLVTRYERPDSTPGGIIIPDSSREDPSLSLYEYIKGSEKAHDVLGHAPSKGSILKTRGMTWPIDTGLYDAESRRALFFIEAEDVVEVIEATWAK